MAKKDKIRNQVRDQLRHFRAPILGLAFVAGIYGLGKMSTVNTAPLGWYDFDGDGKNEAIVAVPRLLGEGAYLGYVALQNSEDVSKIRTINRLLVNSFEGVPDVPERYKFASLNVGRGNVQVTASPLDNAALELSISEIQADGQPKVRSYTLDAGRK